MNDVRKFILALQNNGIEDWQNYESARADSEGFLYIKHKETGNYFKLHVLGDKGIKKSSFEEATPQGTIPRNYKAIEEPLYKQLDDYESPWEKELREFEEQNKSQYNPDSNPETNNFDYYDFNPIEVVNEERKIEEAPPQLDFDEEFQKELEKMKAEQQEMLKKNQKKKPGPNTDKTNENSDKPRGWHLKKEFVDKEGNVYFKGVEQPHLKGTKEPTK